MTSEQMTEPIMQLEDGCKYECSWDGTEVDGISAIRTGDSVEITYYWGDWMHNDTPVVVPFEYQHVLKYVASVEYS